MSQRAGYELIDFGNGRKLERFEDFVLDRPSPAAQRAAPAVRRAWQNADARFEPFATATGDRGRWVDRAGVPLPRSWTIAWNAHPLLLELRRTPFGHVGLFPEQAPQWQWIAERVRQLASRRAFPPRVLNLFAYTGGSTLAAAAAGAEVAHVDAARNIVNWARRNAMLSGLADASIRWIVEDAATFVRRELHRGKQYDGIVLDPPSYGHGPQRQAWKLDRHLPSLLADCGYLLSESGFLVLTCHSAGLTPRAAKDLLQAAIHRVGRIESGEMTLTSTAGRQLPAGIHARWWDG